MSSPHSTLSQELCPNRIFAFRVEYPSAKGFDPLWAGPNATNVPKEAIIVDNSNPDIVYSNPSTWFIVHNNTLFYEGSSAYTTQPGASLNFSFDGVAIWYDCVSYAYNVHTNLFFRYYSNIDPGNSFCTVSIDGSEPERLNGTNSGGPITQQLLWSRTYLAPGRHNFTLRKDDVDGTRMGLDFFRSVTSEVTR